MKENGWKREYRVEKEWVLFNNELYLTNFIIIWIIDNITSFILKFMIEERKEI